MNILGRVTSQYFLQVRNPQQPVSWSEDGEKHAYKS